MILYICIALLLIVVLLDARTIKSLKNEKGFLLKDISNLRDEVVRQSVRAVVTPSPVEERWQPIDDDDAPIPPIRPTPDYHCPQCKRKYTLYCNPNDTFLCSVGDLSLYFHKADGPDGVASRDMIVARGVRGKYSPEQMPGHMPVDELLRQLLLRPDDQTLPQDRMCIYRHGIEVARRRGLIDNGRLDNVRLNLPDAREVQRRIAYIKQSITQNCLYVGPSPRYKHDDPNDILLGSIGTSDCYFHRTNKKRLLYDAIILREGENASSLQHMPIHTLQRKDDIIGLPKKRLQKYMDALALAKKKGLVAKVKESDDQKNPR